MSKVYGLKFGSGNPQVTSGLTPTFIFFRAVGISTYPAGITDMIGPTISELGISAGFYTFQYAPSPTFAIFFNVDGGTALSTIDRYITGVLDPIQSVDEKVGNLEDNIGNGASMTEPNSVLGLLKRSYAFQEGNASFIKGTAIWTYYAKGSTSLNIGFSTALFSKQLTNTISQATKTTIF